MKIVHVITSLKIGGAESALYNLLEHFSTNKNLYPHEHAVVYFHAGPNVEKIRSLGVSLYQVQGLISPYDPIGLYRLTKLIKQLNPQLLHSSLWSANFIARFIARITKIPLISDLHSNCTHHGRLRNVLEHILLLAPTTYIPVSVSVQNAFLQKFATKKNYLPLKVFLIKNGIDSKKLQAAALKEPFSRAELGFGSSDFIIGAVGRLHTIKCYDILIKSFAYLSQTVTLPSQGTLRLCLVGDGPERIALEALTRSLQINHLVTFTGFQEKTFRFYPLFDCFVMSSHSEGLSIALLEALSFALPIVTTGINTYHDVITNGIHGIIVEPNSEIALRSALVTMCTNEQFRFACQRANQQLMNTSFQLDLMAQKYHQIYNSMAKITLANKKNPHKFLHP